MKKICCILALAALLLPALAGASAQGEPTIRIPKVISIVYDDSASMDSTDSPLTGKDDYANYAVKVFLSLLDPEDQVYLTLMSNPFHVIRLDLRQGVRQAMQRMDDALSAGMTPLQAVVSAADALGSHDAANPFSEYWLVIFTDGEFQLDDGSVSLEGVLQEVLDTAMPNKTQAKVGFISIGNDTGFPALKRQNLLPYPRTGQSITRPEDIVEVMQQLANQVSGRAQVPEDKMAVSGNTITFTTDLPSFSIGFLLQNAKEHWVRLTDPAGRELSADIIDIQAWNDDSLTGFSAVFREPGGALPAGRYTVTFQSLPDSFTVLTEPALVLDLKATDTRTGNEGDLALLASDSVDVKGVLHVWNNPQPVDKSLLPGDTVYLLQALQDGKALASTSQSEQLLPNLSFNQQETMLTGSVYMPGIGGVSANRLLQKPDFTLSVLEEQSTFDFRALESNSKGLRVQVMSAGRPLTKDELARHGLEIAINTRVPHLREQLDTGEMLAYPRVEPLRPLDEYGRLPVSLRLSAGGVFLEEKAFAWQMNPPVFTLEGSFLGTDTMPRTALRDSRRLLDHPPDGQALQAAAKTQVIASFRVRMDGQPLTAKDYETWGFPELSLSENAGESLRLSSLVLEDGSILAAPWHQGVEALSADLWTWLDSWTAWKGKADIRLRFAGTPGMELPFTVEMEPLFLFLLRIFLPLLLLVIIIGYFTKRRFAKNATASFASFSDTGGILINTQTFQPERLRQRNIWAFLPYVRSRAQVGSLRFYAGDSAFILVRRESMPDGSCLIGKEQNLLHGRLQAQRDDESFWRGIAKPQDGEKANRFTVLAQSDVLLVTDDRRSGQAYQYNSGANA